MPQPNSKLSIKAQRQAIFCELMAYLTPQDQESVRLLATKLVNMFEHGRDIGRRRVMVAYGGGKDSTYTVGFIRTVQLYVENMLGRTFILRIATMRQSGMPYSVMENIERVYLRLGLIDDITAELIVIDHDQVFGVNYPGRVTTITLAGFSENFLIIVLSSVFFDNCLLLIQ